MPASVARRLDAGHLHAEADAEERHLAFAGEADRGDLAFDPRSPKPPGTRMPCTAREGGDVGIVALEHLGVDPADVDLHPVGHAAMDQRLVQRLVGIGQADIFADDGDRHFALGVLHSDRRCLPSAQVGLRRIRSMPKGAALRIQPFGS
jgi:hypothetical protein